MKDNSNNDNCLSSFGGSLGSLLNSALNTTTDLLITGTCKLLNIESEYIKSKELEKRSKAMEEENKKLAIIEKMESRKEKEKDRLREEEVNAHNTIVIDGTIYNFCDLFFNLGLKNKSKEFPMLLKYQQKELCNIFTFEMPTGITKSQIEEKKEEIASFFEVQESNIDIRKYRNNIDIIVITSDIFDRVYNYDLNIYSNNEGLKIPLGFFLSSNYEMKLLTTDMSKDGHHAMLVAGMSGFGKSTLLRLILIHLILNYTPEQLQIVMFTAKGDNDFLFMYDNVPHLFENKCFIDIDEIVGDEPSKTSDGYSGLLDDLVAEVRVRNALLKEHGCKDINEYHRKGYKDLTYKLVVFDEYAYVHGHQKFDRMQKLMGTLVSSCRSCGIRVIIALQDSQKEYFTPKIRYSTPLKSCFKAENAAHSRNMCNADGLESIRRKGEARFYAPNIPDERDYISFKAILPPEDTDVLIKMVKNKYCK